MAARLIKLGRALSLLPRNHPPLLLFQEQSLQILPSASTVVSRGDLFKRLFQSQANPNGQNSESSESSETAASAPVSELARVSSTINKDEDHDVKHKVISNLKINARHDFMMIFTCKVCETRSVKMACRESYEKGVVVARCAGCNNLHLIADRLGWFGEPGSIEDFLAARGEEVKIDSLDSLNLTFEDLAGKKLAKE